MKRTLLIALLALSGCGLFHGRKAPVPDPTEVIVTGVPAGAFILIDGVQDGDAQQTGVRSRILDVSPGDHIVEIKLGDTVTYRETTYAEAHKKRYVTVLSGARN